RDLQAPLLDVLVGRKAAPAVDALATPSHGAPLLTRARVDDPVLQAVAVGAAHLSAERTGSRRDRSRDLAESRARLAPFVGVRVPLQDVLVVLACATAIAHLLRDHARTVQRTGRPRRARPLPRHQLERRKRLAPLLLGIVRLGDLVLRIPSPRIVRELTDHLAAPGTRRRTRALTDHLLAERI